MWVWFQRFCWFLVEGKWPFITCVFCENDIHPHDQLSGKCLTKYCDCYTEVSGDIPSTVQSGDVRSYEVSSLDGRTEKITGQSTDSDSSGGSVQSDTVHDCNDPEQCFYKYDY